jgi:hypothetical protein
LSEKDAGLPNFADLDLAEEPAAEA